MKNLTYIFDIGSSKISLLACNVHKGESAIVTSVTQMYDGFMDGEFFSTEQLSDVMSNLLTEMSQRVRKTITSVYVGVPSEFCACVCKRATKSFVPARKMLDEEINEMFDGVGDFKGADEYIVSSFSPLQYEIDGNQ